MPKQYAKKTKMEASWNMQSNFNSLLKQIIRIEKHQISLKINKKCNKQIKHTSKADATKKKFSKNHEWYRKHRKYLNDWKWKKDSF